MFSSPGIGSHVGPSEGPSCWIQPSPTLILSKCRVLLIFCSCSASSPPALPPGILRDKAEDRPGSFVKPVCEDLHLCGLVPPIGRASPKWDQFSQIVKPHILLIGRMEKCVCVCPCFYKEHLEESQVEIKSNRNGNQPSQGVAVSPTIWPIS